MIWSLIKVLLFVAVIAALTLGAGILLDTGGGIRIAVAGYEFTFGPLQAVIAALLLVGLVWLLLRIVPEDRSSPLAARWLPVQRKGIPDQWHALRCAVYCPRLKLTRPSSLDGPIRIE